MSNLTDFFSAGGAGGGIGQTITVGDISYPNARTASEIELFFIYQSSNGSNNNYGFQRFDSDEPGWYNTNGGGGSSDWVTVADITSSANGGGVYGAINYFDDSSADHTSRVVEFRITIDGAATTWTSSSRNCYNYSIAYLGPLGNCYMYWMAQSSYGVSGRIDGYEGITQGDDGTVTGWLHDNTTSTYYQNAAAGSRSVNWIKEPSALWGKRAQPYIYFSSTCKVEMKTNRDNSADKYWAGIKLF
tara:strand:+ start:1199 stop:1933 length:735 start_codon:yes stop_codon:yes gene_type:complete